jgi:hypothetical protein
MESSTLEEELSLDYLINTFTLIKQKPMYVDASNKQVTTCDSVNMRYF